MSNRFLVYMSLLNFIFMNIMGFLALKYGSQTDIQSVNRNIFVLISLMFISTFILITIAKFIKTNHNIDLEYRVENRRRNRPQ